MDLTVAYLRKKEQISKFLMNFPNEKTPQAVSYYTLDM